MSMNFFDIDAGRSSLAPAQIRLLRGAMYRQETALLGRQEASRALLARAMNRPACGPLQGGIDLFDVQHPAHF